MISNKNIIEQYNSDRENFHEKLSAVEKSFEEHQDDRLKYLLDISDKLSEVDREVLEEEIIQKYKDIGILNDDGELSENYKCE